MEDEPNYTYLAELVFKAGRYPAHLVVTTGVRDYDTGHYVKTVDRYGTIACIEMAMRLGAEKDLKPFEAVYKSDPEDFKHVYKQTEFISEDQSAELTGLLNMGEVDLYQFYEYMGGISKITDIKAKDYPKAVNAVNAISKAKK